MLSQRIRVHLLYIEVVGKPHLGCKLGLIGFVFPRSAGLHISIILCYNRTYAYLSVQQALRTSTIAPLSKTIFLGIFGITLLPKVSTLKPKA